MKINRCCFFAVGFGILLGWTFCGYKIIIIDSNQITILHLTVAVSHSLRLQLGSFRCLNKLTKFLKRLLPNDWSILKVFPLLYGIDNIWKRIIYLFANCVRARASYLLRKECCGQFSCYRFLLLVMATLYARLEP